MACKIVDLPPTTVFRVASLRYYPVAHSPEGSRKFAGRFNRLGVSALYMSLDLPTAFAEYYKDEPPTPAVVLPFEFRADALIDLRGKLGRWQSHWRKWNCDWEAIRDARLEPGCDTECPSWACGEDAIARNCCGILFPSIWRRGGTNLVLFPENAVGKSFSLDMLDPKGEVRAANPVNRR